MAQMNRKRAEMNDGALDPSYLIHPYPLPTHIQVVARLLLKRGAEVNMQGMHKETPLHDAARNGHFQVCWHDDL